jgi:hypothetical protein
MEIKPESRFTFDWFHRHGLKMAKRKTGSDNMTTTTNILAADDDAFTPGIFEQPPVHAFITRRLAVPN